MNSYKGVVFIASIGLAANVLFKIYNKFKTAQHKKQILQDTPILSLQQLHQLARETQSQTKTVLVKTKCKQSSKYTFNVNLHSNHILFGLVPLSKYLDYAQNKYNQLPDGLLWQAEDNTVFKTPVVTSRNLISYQHHYQSVFDGTDPPGFFMSIIKYTFATIVAIPELFLQAFFKNSNEEPFIDGPYWGNLTLATSIVSNVPFVVCCQLKDGNIFPQFMGFTRQSIVSALKQQQMKWFMVGGLALFLSFLAFYKPVKNVLNTIFDYFYQQRDNFKTVDEKELRRYNPPEIDQEQACIICYNRCRNVVIKKCKHLILCSKCAYDRNNPVALCPFCRQNTENGFTDILSYKE